MASAERRTKNRRTPTQARAARRARRQKRRRFLRWGGAGIVGAIALAFILSLFLPGLNLGGSGGIFGRSAPDGPGDGIASLGSVHIDLNQDHPPYNSVPATSGWHYSQPLAPVRWGIHGEVVVDEYRVHNLEHGGVGVHYDCPDGCDELVENLTRIVSRARGEGFKVLMSPYPSMDTTIALTAWTFIEKLDEFDEQRIVDFIQAHESSPNAPEASAR